MGIGLAALLAVIGTIVLVSYVRGADERALDEEERVEVLVVKQAIAKGTAAADIRSSVEITQVPARLKAAGAVDSLDALDGRVAAVDLVPGEQVVTSRFISAAAAAVADAPPGFLQVTIPIDAARALGGQLRAGDRVGVIASYTQDDLPTTHLVLHKVLVTKVRTGADGLEVRSIASGPAPVGTLFVTLALTAPSVEKVVFAAEHGSVWLSLQPADAPESGTQVLNRQTANL